MNDKLLFSIIIPTYNRAPFIREAVESVLNQTYQNFEIIIVDDGSTDNTHEIIEIINHPKIVYFKTKNAERGHARNYGTLRAKGDYVSFLDSDDRLLPAYLSNAFETIERFNRPAFAHLGYEIINENKRVLLKIDYLKSDDIFFLTKGNSLSCAGCFLRADISKQFLFNEDRSLSGSEDWELWLRVLANHGIKTDNRISSQMINHENRSVNSSHGLEEKLVLRKELALRYAFKDEMVLKKFSRFYKKIDAFGDSYIALHLALIGSSKQSSQYLIKFLKGYPLSIFTKRFLVIIKYIFFKNLKTN